MGVLTLSRKHGEDCSDLNSLDLLNSDNISKKQKLSPFVNQIPDQPTSSKSTYSRVDLYPELKSQFKREVHAPCRVRRFRFSVFSEGIWSKDSSKESSLGDMGNGVRRKKGKLKDFLDCVIEFLFAPFRSYKEEELDVSDEGNREVDGLLEETKDKVVIDVDDVDIAENGGEGCSVIVGQNWRRSDGDTEYLRVKYDGKGFERNFQPSSSALVTDAGEMLDKLSLSRESDIQRVPWSWDVRFQNLKSAFQLDEKILETHKLLWPQKKLEDVKKEVVAEAFKPLTIEEMADVYCAFRNSNRERVMAPHENSCIDITGEQLQCLRPPEWLNDEVINVYFELLKEREKREPQKFLKCHFFNTFFYKKLISGGGGYNFQCVRRWTSQKKLGYCLLDCDKIFVPIHQHKHWCLAVINKKDKMFQYFDSLGGVDPQVMAVLMRYYVDEVKDKTDRDVDISSWRQEFVKDLPEQKNGFDCGMFMIKYADFYSRGLGLCFDQRDIPYFRARTVVEILRLKAE